jgi:hypothetical protein
MEFDSCLAFGTFVEEKPLMLLFTTSQALLVVLGLGFAGGGGEEGFEIFGHGRLNRLWFSGGAGHPN